MAATAWRSMHGAFARQRFIERATGGLLRYVVTRSHGASDRRRHFALARDRDEFAELHLELVEETRAFF